MLQKGKKFTQFSEMENNLRVRNFCSHKNRKNSGFRLLYSVQCTVYNMEVFFNEDTNPEHAMSFTTLL